MAEKLIEAERSLIIAADVLPTKFEGLVRGIGNVAGIGAVKIGFEVGLGLSLPIARDLVGTNIPDAKVIYDHQKAGNDIPDTAENFARAMQGAAVDAAILFPFTGPEVQNRWTKELQDTGIRVIVGAEMTHPKIRQSDGGYIADTSFMLMFENAVNNGVHDFVVPGNKPDKVQLYREAFESWLGAGNFTLYAPGFIEQGGSISAAGRAAGKNWHSIVGRAITGADNPGMAAAELVEQMKASE